MYDECEICGSRHNYMDLENCINALDNKVDNLKETVCNLQTQLEGIRKYLEKRKEIAWLESSKTQWADAIDEMDILAGKVEQ